MNRPVEASYVVAGVSREEVFDALLEVRRFPEWGHGLKEARVVGEEEASSLASGDTLEFVLSALGMTHEVRSTLTVVDPPREIRWRYVSGAAGSGGWLLEEEGPGAVRMTLRTDYRVQPAWLDRIANRPFFRRVTEDLLRRSVRGFQERLAGGL